MATEFHTGLPASGTLTLQCCGRCRQVNYPPRELCGNCLADELHWQPVADGGVVQSLTQLNYSLEPEYHRHLPWAIASVVLECGPVALVHLAPGIAIGARVAVRVIRDQASNRMLLATDMNTQSQQAVSDWLQTVEFEEIQS